jgi:hypothetical protein
MPDVTEEQILKTLLPYLEEAKKDVMGLYIEDKWPGFSIDDLVGKTITGIMKIINSIPYNSNFTTANPDFFKVMIFSDNSYLLHMDIGRNDGSTLHSFLVEKENVRYSRRLYEDS